MKLPLFMNKNDSALEMLRAACDAEPADVGAAVRLMQYYGEQGKYNEALVICNRSLRCSEQDYSLLLEYGNLCFKKGDLKEASEVFKKLTELEPRRIEGWNNQGILQLRRAEIEDASRSFSELIKIQPDHPGALLNLGNYYFYKEDFKEAGSFFQKLVEIRPDFADGWFNLGNTYLTRGNYKQAKTAFKKALEYRPQFFSAYKNLGFVHEKLGEFQKAEEFYRLAAEINKSDAGIQVNLGNVYFLQNNYIQAKRCFLRVVRLAPKNVPGWTGLAKVSLARGDFNTYVRSMLTVLSRLGDEELARSIEVLIQINQLSKAAEILSQADRLGKKGDNLDLQRLLVYQHKGVHKQKVSAIFKRLSSLPVLSDPVKRGLARFSLEKGDCDSAIKFVKQMGSPDGVSYGILWRALLGKKQYGLVKELIQSYAEENQECFDCWFIMARIEAERGSRLQAEKFLIKALENGFTDVDELNECPQLRRIFDSLARSKSNCLETIDKA